MRLQSRFSSAGDYPIVKLFHLLCVSFCLAVGARAEIVVRDDTGATVRLATSARRIVSLAPHVTETLFAAGAGSAIVGTVDYSDYPEAATKLPRVGGYTRLDLEAVAALKPDLVIGVYNATISSGATAVIVKTGCFWSSGALTSGRLFRKSDGTLVLFSGLTSGDYTNFMGVASSAGLDVSVSEGIQAP